MNRNALVVGINTYEQLRPLRSPAKDAEAIAQCLKTYGECNIVRLPEVIDSGQPKVGLKTQVTLQALKFALVQLFKPKGANVPQTAIFFYSGHGIQDDSGIQEGFLATSDADPNRGIYGLSLSWLRRLLQESPVRQKVIWLDCCNSGELLNFREADPGAIAGTDRLFMTASREYQAAFESLDSPYSIFTQALLKGLDPNRVESGVINNYALTDWVSNDLKGEIQQPLFENSGSEIILTRTNRASALVTETRQPVEKGVCPYKGLSFFDANDEDAKYFYGRRELTDQLLDKVRQGNFLAILGASGSGKSSLLRAGLLHQLKLGRRLSGSDQWEIHVLVPGNHPLQSLALAFVNSDATGIERAKQLAAAEELIGKGATGLRQLVQASPADRVILAIDQFEETFTLCQNNTERQQFFQCLLDGLAQTESKLCLILAMRADFLGKCLEQDYSGLAQQIQDTMIAVTPMSREELRQAIVEPAKQAGLDIEPELVQELLRDVEGSPGSLPLLQYTLTELWKQATDHRLDLRTYSQLGGVMGTLQKRATAVYEQFSNEQKPVVKHLFLALTQLGEGTEDTRRRVRKPELVNQQYSASLIDPVIQRLADEKLIVTNELIEKGHTGGYVSVIDISHETLIRHWTLLRKWIEENRDVLRQERRIELAAEEWRDRDQSSDYLLQGKPLQDAIAFQQDQQTGSSLSTLAEQFIQASVQKRRADRWKFVSFAIAPGVALIAVPLLMGIITLQNQLRQAENEQQKALTEYMALATQALAGDRSGLGLDSYKIVRDQTLEVVQKLNPGRKAQLLQFLYSFQLIRSCELDGKPVKCVNPRPAMISIEGAEFDGLEFTHRVLLERSNLSGVSLKGATLQGATLVDSDLSRSDLTNANLNDTLMVGAHLEDAHLKQTKFRGADLSNAFLHGTDLSEADLTNAKLTGAKYNNSTKFPSGFNPDGAGMVLQ
jgi:energy-coupling factor transporter ATP-binding protein EcfA2